MKFLALETNPRKLSEPFVVEGEKELLVTSHHFFLFFTRMILAGIITLLAIGLGVLAATFLPLLVTTIWILVWGCYFLLQFLRHFVAWRYNFLIVTSDKIVLVEHRMFFHQAITPIHLTDIFSTAIESQYWGIVRCGSLRIAFKELAAGKRKELVVSHLPNPGGIAGIIDNAIVLTEQKVKPTGEVAEQEHEQRMDAVAEKGKNIEEPPKKE